jgi:hypothetical protein
MLPHPIAWRSILIISSHLFLALPSGPFPQVFPPKPCMHLSSVPIHATCLAHLLYLITQIISVVEYRSLSFSLCSLLHSCYLIPLRPKHPQPTFLPRCERPSFAPIQNNRQIIVMYILFFKFMDSKLGDKRFRTEW